MTDETTQNGQEQKAERPEEQAPETPAFHSALAEGRDRFLSEIVEEGFRSGVVNADAFVRRFPPARIMEAFADSADRRADFVHGISQTDRKIALRLGAEASGEVIQIALEEKVATTKDLVTLFLPDERVSRLDRQELWSFCTEWEPWSKQRDDTAYADAQRYTAFILERALGESLIIPPHVTEALTLDAIRESLILSGLLHDLLKDAIGLGREGKPFTDDDLIRHVTPRVIVERIDVAVIWDKLVRPHIAEEHGFVAKSEAPPEAPPEEPREEVNAGAAMPDENVSERNEADWSDVADSIKGDASGKEPADPKACEAPAAAAGAADPALDDDDEENRMTLAPPRLHKPLPLEGPSVEVDRTSIIEVDVSELEEEDILLENTEMPENYIPDEEFARVGGDSSNQTPRERTIVPDESKIRKHVVELLKETDLTLPDKAEEMPLKDLFIRLLSELDSGTYGDISQSQGTATKDLGNVLCRELMNRNHEQLSDKLRDALYTILGVDPDRRSYMPPQTRHSKEKRKRR